jgi:DNA-directed RNA polymerase subunit L
MNTDILNIKLKSKYDEEKNIKQLIKESYYLDTSYVNAIRRYAISNILTLAFEYHQIPENVNYINIIKNNSNMNNDFIGHRIGLLPININAIKYLLLIYKIISGNHNYLDELKKQLSKNPNDTNERNNIYKLIKTNLKLSNKNNIDLIHKIIFYIDEFNDTDLKNITTLDIKIKFENESTDIDYVTKLSNYTELFELYEEYNDNNIKNIDINNFKNELLKFIFKPFIAEEREYGTLLCKLKKNETINCELKLNIGCGYEHSRWCVVCPISYIFVIDNVLVKEILLMKLEENKLLNKTFITDFDNNITISDFIDNRYKDIINFNLNHTNIEQLTSFLDSLNEDNSVQIENVNLLKKIINKKDDLLNIFNKCDKQRYFYGKDSDTYKREFLFTIESNNFYTCKKILYKAHKLLKKDLLNIIHKIIKLLEDFVIFPIKTDDIYIDISKKIINGIDIYYNNGDHSIGNILQSYIYYFIEDSIISYIGYKMVHPLKSDMLLTIGYQENITNINFETLKIFYDIYQIFQNMDLDNFIHNDDE